MLRVKMDEMGERSFVGFQFEADFRENINIFADPF